MKKFISEETGKVIQTNSKSEIKMYRACGWKEVKTPKQSFAKGLKNGKNFLY